jgi:steroid 5-alpha reductase family enzyme
MTDVFSFTEAWDVVSPLINDLAVLPETVSALIRPHLGVHPLPDTVLIFILLSAFMWFIAVLTNNSSWVDRSWSIIPQAYMYYVSTYGSTPRLRLMIFLGIVWGCRLTGNFIRKGGYNPLSEAFQDYRWPILRKRLGEPIYQIFCIVFVAIYQNFILFLISVPTAYFAHKSTVELYWLDYVAAAILLSLLAVEFVADNQMWKFQSNKQKLIEQGAYKGVGFITTGLFRYSRHPNFFAEFSIWWCFYLFSVAASGLWLNWCIIGPILLTILFHGSTDFTEQISVGKYPLYKKYQQSTSRLIPLWPGAPIADKLD